MSRLEIDHMRSLPPPPQPSHGTSFTTKRPAKEASTLKRMLRRPSSKPHSSTRKAMSTSQSLGALHRQRPPWGHLWGFTSQNDRIATLSQVSSVGGPPPDQVWSMDLTPRPPPWWWKGLTYLLLTYVLTFTPRSPLWWWKGLYLLT